MYCGTGFVLIYIHIFLFNYMSIFHQLNLMHVYVQIHTKNRPQFTAGQLKSSLYTELAKCNISFMLQ